MYAMAIRENDSTIYGTTSLSLNVISVLAFMQNTIKANFKDIRNQSISPISRIS